MSIADTPTSPSGLTMLARSYPRGMRLGLHAHREAQLLFAASGMMQVTTPRGRWLVPPQRAVWIPPRLGHAVDALADVEMRALLVEPAWLAAHTDAAMLDREFVVVVRPLLREIVLALFAADHADAQRLELLARLAVCELAEAEDATTFMPMPTDPRLRRVADLILADPSGEHALEDLARVAGASPRSITRLFPAETKLTFKAWRQRARIMAALEALGGGRTSIKQVAGTLRFSSVAAFGHAFRQVTGTTPSFFLEKSGRMR